MFDNTHNTTASDHNSNPGTHYGYNDLLANVPTTGHPEEYRAYSNMYNYLYGSSGYENTTLKLYTSILQPLNVCLNKIDDYAGINNTSYTTTTRVTDTCNVSGKSNTTVVPPLKNKYVRLPYVEEYLNASLESTCRQNEQYQCRNQNYLYNKTTYWTLNGVSFDSWNVNIIKVGGHAHNNSGAYNNNGVRPVVILKPSVLISGGTGTQTSPYVIKW